jgi:hypothetical protein
MNIERVPERLIRWIVIIMGILSAVMLARKAADEQYGTIIAVFVSVFFIGTLLVMRGFIWLLIPIFWTLVGQMQGLALPFAARDIVIALVFLAFLALSTLKAVRRKPEYELLDKVLLLLLLYILSVFVRNPVGFQAIGSDRVGGRPYISAIFGCLAYWVLVRSSLPDRWGQRLLIAMLAGQLIEGVLSTIAYYFPSTTPSIAYFYSNVFDGAFQAGNVNGPEGENAGRLIHLSGIGVPLALFAVAFWKPLTLINPLHIWRFLFLSAAFFAILLSGFRNLFLAASMYFILSSWLYHGLHSIVRFSIIATPFLAIALMLQGTFLNLPLSAQRALSFLPGKWDNVAVAEARESTEWRVFMWKEALFGDKYIHSKWFGDGFGFSMTDLQIMAANTLTGNTADQHENLLISGGVHSGPVSTIRYVGYIGLIIFLYLIYLTARNALHIIRRARGTPFFILTLFIGLPILWFPFHFILVYGAFERDLPTAIYAIGILRMLKNSLQDYEAKRKSLDFHASHAETHRSTLPQLV